MKKIIMLFGLIILFSIFSGCIESEVTSELNESLVGTWESGVVNGYYIHQKTLGIDGSYIGRWLYASDRSVYSEVTGTWTADCCTLTTVTDHTDSYSFTLTGSNTLQLIWGSESRIYYRS